MCECAMVCNAGVAWQNAAIVAENSAAKYRAPHVLMRPDLAKDGNMWSALYGSNIQEGVCGFGETPEAAMADFDKNWREQKIVVPAT